MYGQNVDLQPYDSSDPPWLRACIHAARAPLLELQNTDQQHTLLHKIILNFFSNRMANTGKCYIFYEQRFV